MDGGEEPQTGITGLELEVGNPARPDDTRTLEFLIDSGAVYSVVPAPVLEELGIQPLGEETFRLADGSKIARKKGIALFRYGDRVGGADVVFGEEGDCVLVGSLTLEALGLSLDPLKRELKPLPLLRGLDRHGRDRGWAAGLVANYGGKHKGSHWLLVGVTSPGFYRHGAVARLLARALRAMVSGEAAEAAAATDREDASRTIKLRTPAPSGHLRLSDDGTHIVRPYVRRYAPWLTDERTRVYEERFGLFYYDGTPEGRPKPIVHALRVLRDYVERAGPGGKLAIRRSRSPIGAGYVFRGERALFVGGPEHQEDRLAFACPRPANVMLTWDDGSLAVLSTADVRVRLDPAAFVPALEAGKAEVSGRHGGWEREGRGLAVELLAGETVQVRASGAE